MRELIHAILLGIVEGVTEFLPISSTGHLLLAEQWLRMDLEDDPFWRTFTIVIQIGAIAAVVVYFRERLLHLLRGGEAGIGNGNGSGNGSDRDIVEVTSPGTGARAHVNATDADSAGGDSGGIATAPPPATAPPVSPPRIRLAGNRPLMLIVVGSLPLCIAVFAEKLSEDYQKQPIAIAAALGIGGLLMILLERFRPSPRTHVLEQMTYGQALLIGFCQVLAAVFPGTSRSAATILGGLTAGLSRETAAEFSFFLAIPAMLGACGYKLARGADSLSLQQGMLLTVGTLVSFLVAWGVIGWFMHYIHRHTFVPFAVYRIVLAVVVLSLAI